MTGGHSASGVEHVYSTSHLLGREGKATLACRIGPLTVTCSHLYQQFTLISNCSPYLSYSSSDLHFQKCTSGTIYDLYCVYAPSKPTNSYTPRKTVQQASKRNTSSIGHTFCHKGINGKWYLTRAYIVHCLPQMLSVSSGWLWNNVQDVLSIADTLLILFSVSGELCKQVNKVLTFSFKSQTSSVPDPAEWYIIILFYNLIISHVSCYGNHCKSLPNNY